MWQKSSTMTREQPYGEYGSYHQERRNRFCHAIGIPLIVLGILGLLALVRLGPADLAVLAAIAVRIYYLTRSRRPTGTFPRSTTKIRSFV